MPIAPNRLKDTERSFPISENYRTRASALHALTVIRLLDGGRLVLPQRRPSSQRKQATALGGLRAFAIGVALRRFRTFALNDTAIR